MDLSANVYSTSTIAAAAACLGAVLVGVYVVWGPDFFFRKKGALASSIIVCCTIVNTYNDILKAGSYSLVVTSMQASVLV